MIVMGIADFGLGRFKTADDHYELQRHVEQALRKPIEAIIRAQLKHHVTAITDYILSNIEKRIEAHAITEIGIDSRKLMSEVKWQEDDQKLTISFLTISGRVI